MQRPPLLAIQPKHPAIAVARALLAAAVVIYCFVALVHVTVIQPSLIKNLGIRNPGISVVVAKPSSTQVLDMPSSPFKAVQAAYKADPAHTAGYSTIWNSPPHKTYSAVLVFDILPTARQATTVYNQANSEFFSKKAFKQYTKEIHFAIPQIPGAVAWRLFSAKTAQAPASQSVMVNFTYHRVVVILILSGTTALQSQGVTVSLLEYHHLQKTEPTFVMAFVVKPIVGSVFYWIGGLLFIALAYGAPTWFVESRERRKEDQEAAVRRHYQVRGSKVLRRQKARTYRR